MFTSNVPIFMRYLSILLVLISLVTLFCSYSSLSSGKHRHLAVALDIVDSRPKDSQWDSKHWLVGEKTGRYEDNLRQDVHYITSGACSGFTNLFIGFVNMLYLASITDRVPILPPFTPNAHISQSNPSVPFGEVFDLVHFREAARLPVLEWHEVKDLSVEAEPEQIGCWSTWWRNDSPADWCLREDVLGLDVSYTRPDERFRINNEHALFYPIAELIFPDSPINSFEIPLWKASKRSSHDLRPNTHLACFDDLYFSSTSHLHAWEWWTEWSPEWRFIGRHLKFSAEITNLAKDVLETILDRQDEPFIAIHIRHGDFAPAACSLPAEQRLECFPPLEKYAKRVKSIQDELLSRDMTQVNRVIVASDEKDPLFWRQVAAMGWNYMNHTHLQTVERYGSDWYPVFIDSAILSMSVGLVGTDGSTLSLLASKRVRDWNRGIAHFVSNSES